MKQVCALEFQGGISLALFVNEQRKGNSGFLSKSASIDAISQAYGCQVSPAIPEGLFVGAQLRDVLAAKDSTVMAQENNHRGLAEP